MWSFGGIVGRRKVCCGEYGSILKFLLVSLSRVEFIEFLGFWVLVVFVSFSFCLCVDYAKVDYW